MPTEINLHCKIYPNATEVKIKNRRISVQTINNDELLICFRKLPLKEDFGKPVFYDVVVKDKITVTMFKLTAEGAFALHEALGRELSKLK